MDLSRPESILVLSIACAPSIHFNQCKAIPIPNSDLNKSLHFDWEYRRAKSGEARRKQGHMMPYYADMRQQA
jgi:hypothetical protein